MNLLNSTVVICKSKAEVIDALIKLLEKAKENDDFVLCLNTVDNPVNVALNRVSFEFKGPRFHIIGQNV